MSFGSLNYILPLFPLLDPLFPVLHSHFSQVLTKVYMGRDNSVGIAIRYELDGPWIELRWRRDFRHLRPTQPAVQWVTGLSSGGGIKRSGLGGDQTPLLAPILKKE